MLSVITIIIIVFYECFIFPLNYRPQDPYAGVFTAEIEIPIRKSSLINDVIFFQEFLSVLCRISVLMTVRSVSSWRLTRVRLRVYLGNNCLKREIGHLV